MKCAACPGETAGFRIELCPPCSSARDAVVAMLERGGAAALRVVERAIKATEHVRAQEAKKPLAVQGPGSSLWPKKFWGRNH